MKEYDTFHNIDRYRIMWILVFFDLPVETKEEKKAASDFRKNLLKDGFSMMQYSIYMRNCMSRENMQVHIDRVKNFLPNYGKVNILHITEKQFGMMEMFFGRTKTTTPKPNDQLMIF